MNVNESHWITLVMHNTKKEFQVLNSQGKISTRVYNVIDTLRAEIAKDIREANLTVKLKYPDVSSWPIKEYDMPRQSDGCS